MPQEFLDGPNVIIGLQQVSGKAMTKGMDISGFGCSCIDARSPRRDLYKNTRIHRYHSNDGFEEDDLLFFKGNPPNPRQLNCHE